jgi:hypothetical protein
VSSEWFNRPDDERYLSLDDLWANVKERYERSWVVQSADTQVEAARDNPERRLLGSGLNDPKGRNGPNTFMIDLEASAAARSTEAHRLGSDNAATWSAYQRSFRWSQDV